MSPIVYESAGLKIVDRFHLTAVNERDEMRKDRTLPNRIVCSTAEAKNLILQGGFVVLVFQRRRDASPAVLSGWRTRTRD